MQLVPENRGANSIITTFEGRPYTNEFSGNVTELCPVGALTSTTYRFLARPWEIQNVPTTCAGCAVGCNTYATIREGRVARVLSRNHPEVDEGWLCDKGRYGARPPAQPRARDAEPDPRRARPRGGLDDRRPRPRRRPAARDRRAVRPGIGRGAGLGEQTNEEAHAWARLLAEALGGGASVCGPEGGSWWSDLEPYAASIADLAGASAIVVAGDADLGHRAPVLELWIRKAVRQGAQRLHRRPRRDPPGHAARRGAHLGRARHRARRAARGGRGRRRRWRTRSGARTPC